MMLDLIKLLFAKKGFTCRVLPPGSVFASPVNNKKLIIIIDLDEADA